MWCLDGAYGDFITPYTFQAKKGNYNPDILSWSQIKRINDKDTSLQINIAANSYNRDTLLLSKFVIMCTVQSKKGLNLKKQSNKFESDLKFTEIWNCIKWKRYVPILS